MPQESSVVTDPWAGHAAVDIYGSEDWANEGWIVGGTRNQARAIAASVWGADYVAITARRVHLRPWTRAEIEACGGAHDVGVSLCEPDHPHARRGWEIEV